MKNKKELLLYVYFLSTTVSIASSMSLDEKMFFVDVAVVMLKNDDRGNHECVVRVFRLTSYLAWLVIT